ncbi:MAG: IS66 family transposase [Deltaproteobacteria bacterium]|nr:IS66 family transposase [Deltaproteobacteria bacterium]
MNNTAVINASNKDLVKSFCAMQSENGVLKKEVEELKLELAKMTNLCLQLKKHVFGQRSEKRHIIMSEPLPMFPAEEIQIKEPEEEITVEAHSRKKYNPRKPLPDNLPREIVIHEPTEQACSCCGAELVKIGEEKSEEIEYIPAKMFVREHIRIKKACPKCKGEVRIAQLPSEFKPPGKARPGVGLVSHIAVSKYGDHLPLNRQEQMFERIGIEIPRQRMWDWLKMAAQLLEPLYESLRQEIAKEDYLQADETRMMVQVDDKADKLHTGYLWGIHSPPGLVYYHYSPTRAGDVPLELLKGFKGYVQTDFYGGYNELFLQPEVLRIACLAHVRRKLIDAQAPSHSKANKLLTLICELYKIEKTIKNTQSDERLQVRQSKSRKLLEQLFDKAEDVQLGLLPQHPLWDAINYMLKQKTEILRCTDDARFHLDNNSIERAMRPVAIGRKNYMFAGCHEGTRVAALFYSLITSCKFNKVNPYEYLADVMRRINDHKHNRLVELLPHRWKRQS